MWWRELDEVENECTLHNFSLFTTFLPKIIKIGGNLTKFWQKQFYTVFWDTVYMPTSALSTTPIVQLRIYQSGQVVFQISPVGLV